ncbi:MAG: glycoside hydrolase family 13 protein [Bacteroidales bacterium]|nr:glycoside hydrolase family 13 protein [Bacteroidales bacterium]
MSVSSLGAVSAASPVPARQRIDRVEPPCWWIGMKTPLQLMIHGSGLRGAKVVLSAPVKGVEVKEVHYADSPNYIFADIGVSPDAVPQVLRFDVICSGGLSLQFRYELKARREGSAERKGFDSGDLVYLLVPDRFANGDPSNDNVPGCADSCDRSRPGKRHGGDLQGIMDHLDYLSELGVTCIWPTPVLLDNEPKTSYHGYACSDYYKVDPRFGTEGSYRALVAAAHGKGLKFIMDMVPNHCATSHWWMDDLPFHDWINIFPKYTQSNFAISTVSDPHATKYDYGMNTRGWFDRTMADMNLCNPYVLQYFKQWAVWWIEYADLDGLRVDTFPYSDKHAIADWTGAIMKEYPSLNIVAECWVDNSATVSYWEGAHENADGYTSNLPSVMDFPLMEAIVPAFNENDPHPAWGEGIIRIYNVIARDFTYHDPNSLLIFASNHDTRRLAYQLGYDLKRVKMAMALLATMRGTPEIYYGDEMMLASTDGHTGDIHERVDFPGGWVNDTINLFVARKGRNAKQRELFGYVSKLFNYRKTSPALRYGSLLHCRPENNNLYVYFRRLEGSPTVMVLMNNASRSVEITDWTPYEEGLKGGTRTGTDIETGLTVALSPSLTVPAKSAMVLELK